MDGWTELRQQYRALHYMMSHGKNTLFIHLITIIIIIIIIIIITKRQPIGRRKMSMKSLQGRHTANAARIKLKIRVHNTTVETNEF